MTVLLFIASRDWETVKNVAPRNGSSKPDQLGIEGKGDEHAVIKCLIILIFYLSIYSLFIF